MPNNLDKKDLTDHAKSVNVDIIWQRLKNKATEIQYGSLSCVFEIHQGCIFQVDVTQVTERIREHKTD